VRADVIELTIASREKANQIVRRENATGNKNLDVLVSIATPEDSRTTAFGEQSTPCSGFTRFRGRSLFLRFDDTDVDGPLAPKAEHVERMVTLALETLVAPPKVMRVLVHCAAGISRSTATAIVMLVAAGYTPQEAVRMVDEATKGGAWPNQLIISLGDARWNLDGALVAAVNEYKSQRTGKLWTP